jgi:hypothetical protein
MRREKSTLPKGAVQGVRLAMLAPWAPLFLFCAQPALAAGQLRAVLEAEGGLRSDGNYGRLNSTGNAEDRLRTQSVLFGQAGFNLNLSYTRQRLDLALIYSPFYAGTLNHKELGTISGVTHRLSFGLTGQLSRRSVLRLSETFLSSPTAELFGPTLVNTQAVPRRGNQLLENADAELDTDLTRSVVFLVGGDGFVRHFDDPNLVDSRGVEGRTGLRFHIDEGRDLELRAGTSFYRLAPGVSAHVTTGTAAYRTTFSRGSVLRFEVGGYSVTNDGVVDQPDRTSGVQGSVNLSRQGQLYRGEASYSHGVAPGVGIAQPVVLDNAFLGLSTVGRSLNWRLGANGARSSDLTRRRAVNPPVDTTNANDRLVDFASGTLEATWSFADRGRLHAGYSRVWQRSEIPGFGNVSFNRFFLGLGLVIYSTGETPKVPGEQGVENVEPHAP